MLFRGVLWHWQSVWLCRSELLNQQRVDWYPLPVSSAVIQTSAYFRYSPGHFLMATDQKACLSANGGWWTVSLQEIKHPSVLAERPVSCVWFCVRFKKKDLWTNTQASGSLLICATDDLTAGSLGVTFKVPPLPGWYWSENWRWEILKDLMAS